MRKLSLYVCLALLLNVYSTSAQQALLFQDNMDGINDSIGLTNRGYLVYNRSTGPTGVAPMWFQGNSPNFVAYNGPDSGYLAANYNCVMDFETINNWLVLPELNLSVDDTLVFYSQSTPSSVFPDSIRVMYSATGDTTPEGLAWVELGRFQVNTNGFWERKSFTIPTPGIHGRLAIRYAVVDGGTAGLNADYIGIDEVEVVSGSANIINGKVYVDQNSNGIYDAGDLNVPNQKIVDLNSGRFTFSQPNGEYNVAFTDSGNYEVLPVGLNYYSSSPASHAVYFNSIMQIDSANDFALTAIGAFNDLCVTITPMGNIRPGFDVSYMVNYSNVGTTTLTPTVSFIPDTNLSYLSSSLNPLVFTNDTIYWSLPNISPYQSGNLLITLHVNVTTPFGTPITSKVILGPLANDVNTYCNYSYSTVPVTGSYDPNDILVNEDTLISTAITPATYLDYVIRFQNTGNDTAFNISVSNTITTDLDINSFELLSSSHPISVNYNNLSRELYFMFENILLPDSFVNEQRSHGFVHYKIKPKATIAIGDVIENYASIYFDFNAPVSTNIASTIVIIPTGIENDPLSVNSLFNIYPNPVRDELHIEIKNKNAGEIKLEIYDLMGKLVLTKQLNLTVETKCITKQLPKGFYTAKIKDSINTYIKGFVKN